MYLVLSAYKVYSVDIVAPEIQHISLNVYFYILALILFSLTMLVYRSRQKTFAAWRPALLIALGGTLALFWVTAIFLQCQEWESHIKDRILYKYDPGFGFIRVHIRPSDVCQQLGLGDELYARYELYPQTLLTFNRRLYNCVLIFDGVTPVPPGFTLAAKRYGIRIGFKNGHAFKHLGTQP